MASGYASPEANKLLSIVEKFSDSALSHAAIEAATRLDETLSDLTSLEEERELTSKQLLSIRSRVAEWRQLEGKLKSSMEECASLRERVGLLEEEIESRAATEDDLRGRLSAAAEAGLRIEGEHAAEALRCREEFTRQREELESLRMSRDALLLQLSEGRAQEQEGAETSLHAPIVEARAAALQAQLQNLGVLIKHRDAILLERDAQKAEIERLEVLLEEAQAEARRASVVGGESESGTVTLNFVTPVAQKFPPRTSPSSHGESPGMLSGEDEEPSPGEANLRKVVSPPPTGSGCCTVA